MNPSSKIPKTLVIGLGQIGYNNCEYMTRHGLNVDGYDISDEAVQHALNTGVIKNEATSFKGYDYYIICVSTHNPQNMSFPSLEGFFDVIRRLADEGNEGSLVAIESTITKGTSRKANNILNHRLHVAHVPHRFYSEDKDLHGIKQTRVLGGCGTCCATEALYFYLDLLNIPIHVVEDIELAELSKIIENTYRMIQIAFAEELKMFCDIQALDFTQLRKAINSKWNVEILEARSGINGHCLPKDSQMYLRLTEQTIPFSIAYSAKAVDGQYKRHIRYNKEKANLIEQAIEA
ncbi:MAG: potassium transporter TrkA [Candidatus Bathyarchaeum sp.]|nr:MAG: potassium transporter TrkA [Candidatus Bathyarchaeum sp.]